MQLLLVILSVGALCWLSVGALPLTRILPDLKEIAFSKEERLRIGRARGWKCAGCGRCFHDGWLMEFHHLIPRSLAHVVLDVLLNFMMEEPGMS